MYFFYISQKERKIVITDYGQDMARKKLGYAAELVNTVKDKDSIALVLPRIQRSYPNYIVEELYAKPKYVMTPEHKQALINSKLGKKRTEEVKKKISETKKGKSGFQNKKHSYETKRLMAARKLGNQHNKDYVWAYDPVSDKEVRVKELSDIPKGYTKGRDYYSTEAGLYEMSISRSRSRNK